MGETLHDRMHTICTALWKNCDWPEDWCSLVLVPLPKKRNTKQCTNYGTIALVSYACKVILQLILERMRKKLDAELSDEQADFKRGRETRDNMSNLRILMEKSQEHQQALFIIIIIIILKFI